MSRKLNPFILIIFILQASFIYSTEKTPANSQDSTVLRVGIIPLQPFVIIDNGTYRGISIELWEKIAKKNQWSYHYVVLPQSGYLDIEPLLHAHKLDVVIGPIAITYKRINEMEFSTPYFITTSNVMSKKIPSSFSAILIHFFKNIFRVPLLFLLFIALLSSFLIWLKERKHFPDRFPESIWKGIPYSIWYGFHTIFAVDIFFEIKDAYSRVLTIIMLICSVIIVSIFTASLTSALTLSHLGFASSISSLYDLRSQPVAIISGTDVKEYLEELGANIIEENSIPQAIQALNSGNVTTIVADKLVMQNYLQHHPENKINITGLVVRSNIVAFALPKGSKLKEPINDTIVDLQNSNQIYKICLSYLNRQEAAFCNL